MRSEGRGKMGRVEEKAGQRGKKGCPVMSELS